jgi:hypothetical protein
MYRIRLPSGEQSVFRTLDELTLAVQSGVVGPSAEVYLADTNRWMPVESHAAYQAARIQPAPQEELPPQNVPHTTLAPLPLAEAPTPAPAPGSAPAPSPVLGTTGESPAAASPGPTATSPSPQLPASVFMTRARKLREMLALKLGLFLVIGGSVLLTVYLAGTRAHWPATGPEAHEGMTPPAEAPAPVQPVPTPPPEAASAVLTPDSAAAELAQAGTPKPLPSTRESLAAAPTIDPYLAGYDDAREELDDGMAYIRFNHVFSPARMRSADSVRATRRAIAAAGNIVRTYRAREVMLEQTVGATRPESTSKRESFEAGMAVRDLLDDADSLYALLSSQYGRYSLSPDSILFANATAATVWNRVRGRLLGNLRVWDDSVSTSARVTMPRLVKSLGNPPPPLARQ